MNCIHCLHVFAVTLYRVAENEEYNKMSLQNLAMVFGPTLLRPAITESHRTPMEQLLLHGNEVAVQTTILLYFLNLKQKNFPFSRQA